MRQAGIAVSIVQIRKVDMGMVNVWQSLEMNAVFGHSSVLSDYSALLQS